MNIDFDISPLPRMPSLTRELTARILPHLAGADRALHAAILEIHDAGQQAELRELKFRLAKLMSITYDGVTRRLYEQHPDLCPPDLRVTLYRDPASSPS